MTNFFVLLMGPPQNGEGSGMSTWIMLGAIFVIFWLFFIRPQTKKNKEMQKFREGLKKGDRVITIGGIHGKVLTVNERDVIIETEGQGKLKVEKSAISLDGVQQEQVAQKR